MAVATGRHGKRVHQHAGRSRYFLIYEIVEDENGRIKIKNKNQIELSKDQILHNVLHREPMNFEGHPLEDAEIIITGGIGPGGFKNYIF